MKLLGTQHPIVLAPMAGAADADLAIAVAEAGGLGSIPCAALTPAQIRAQVTAFRDATRAPLNVNFFAHRLPPNDPDRGRRWRERVAKRRPEQIHPPRRLPRGRARLLRE
jgi:nitronate monooxygenase